MPSLAGAALETVTLGGMEATARLLTFLEGTPLNASRYLPAETIRAHGRLAGEVCRALAGFEHPGLEAALQWNLRLAEPVVSAFAPSVRSPELRRRLLAATREASARLAPLRGDLPLQAIHGDVTDFNVVCSPAPDGRPAPVGVIDLGDLSTGWRVAELAVTCASILRHLDADPLGFLPAVRAFEEIVPLADAERAALWPLVVLRSAVLVASDEQQLSIDPENAYASDGLVEDLATFRAATSLPWALVEAAVGLRSGPLPWSRSAPGPSPAPLLPWLAAADVAVLDLSTTSEALDGGRWQAPSVEDTLFAEAARAADAVAARHGEFRLTRAVPGARAAPPTCALHAELRLPAGATLCAPAAAVARHVGPGRPRPRLRGGRDPPARRPVLDRRRRDGHGRAGDRRRPAVHGGRRRKDPRPALLRAGPGAAAVRPVDDGGRLAPALPGPLPPPRVRLRGTGARGRTGPGAAGARLRARPGPLLPRSAADRARIPGAPRATRAGAPTSTWSTTSRSSATGTRGWRGRARASGAS